ncbi:MAG TPA: MazG nucleotide pyrophosphohydrolase domain-containing protein [Aeromicrobium sp.]|nr:MazG nucleotide pyrophosphohydrolase domain-containing protein [Aeromicrobium sp.]
MSAEFDRLVAVMAQLRTECLWTQQQTHQSLRRYVIEEAYEVAEAIDGQDGEHLADELGDLLMQVVFHSAIAESDGEGWAIADVVRAITEKLIHRNPHVFGDVTVSSVAEIDENWQRLKAESKTRRPSSSDVRAELPALLAAAKVLRRLDSPVEGEDIGSRMLRLVAEAEAAGLDPEAQLRAAISSHVDSKSG